MIDMPMPASPQNSSSLTIGKREPGLVGPELGDPLEAVEADLGRLLDHRPGRLLALVPLGRGRAHHALGEPVNPVADVLLVVGELEREGGAWSAALHWRWWPWEVPILGCSRRILHQERMILRPVSTTESQKLVGSLQLSPAPWEALPPGMGEVLRPGLARTADEMIDAIRSAVPAYARPLDGAFGAGIRTGVVRALEQFVSAVEGARRRPPGARDIYFELGRGEAREGRALEALLSAYRVGRAGGVAQRGRQRPRGRPGGATCSPRSPSRCSRSSTSCPPARPRATHSSSP